MELVSAAKMRKAIASVLCTRPYATFARDVLRHLSSLTRTEELHPLLEVRPVRTVGIVVMSTNRGLCGGFNANIANLVRQRIAEEKNNGATAVELFTVGKRARDLLARVYPSISADFPKKDITTSIVDLLPLAHMIIKRYSEKTLDRVTVVYTDYISSVKQKAIARNILPLTLESFDEQTGATVSDSRVQEFSQSIFEPSPELVLGYVIPRLMEVQLFQAVLESEASEHSARMLAMHNASEAATDILSDLRLTYNQIRQSGITQEIAEISSGRAALE